MLIEGVENGNINVQCLFFFKCWSKYNEWIQSNAIQSNAIQYKNIMKDDDVIL